MAGLIDKLKRSDTAPEDTPLEAPPVPEEAAAPAPPLDAGAVTVPDDASRLCVNCASLLAEGQDWCLECGTAQPGRLGSRPGWRPALTIVAITAILALGAVAAAYAALSSDAERRASAPPPPNAQPVVPAPPVQTTPAPAEEPAPLPVPADDAADDPEPSDDSADDPAPPADSGTDDTSGSTDTGGSSGSSGAADTSGSGDSGGDTSDGDTPAKKPSPTIALAPGAASTFDPLDRAGGLTGDPADAIDGRRKTAWEAPSAASDGRVDIGLLVSLEKAQAIDQVRLQADTPGFDVTLYGSKLGTAPEGAPGTTKYWQKLDATRDFGTDEKLDAGGGTYRHVLLWFTQQPADTKVMIPEVELYR